ncbi:MAG: NapC/NirT family cytochrome c [Bacteroidetes bacterium]|nr:NapC/NirT family cytochrome c [Bacteroidota bacterium]
MKLPRSLNNWTSLIGVTVALVALFMIVFLFVISVFLKQGSSYLGLFIYIILPVFLIAGLLLIPVGMIRTIRKDKRDKKVEEPKWPVIDFNNYRQRNAFMLFGVGSMIFLLLSAVGSYEAFHFTESVEFCGKLCHKVMNPEYTAYQNSAHARVACVECHVGSGANWYVKSKLSGLYQVYAATFNTYPRPIPTPISSLRPARETCEKCHWPQKFYANQDIIEKHFLSDGNVEWDINLRMKVGPQYSALGLKEGIHWHINPNIKIEYKAGTKDRESIPWVKYTNLKTGEVYVYNTQDKEFTDEQLNEMETRVMDCMDCHNRPSHDYQTPQYFIDNGMTSGIIPKDLPDMKFVAMEALNDKFSTTDSAVQFIRNEVNKYYQDSYPEIVATDSGKALVDKAIEGIITQFERNVFPEMNVRWNAYPNHIGHIEFTGCFRCHDNLHTSDKGHIISKDCNLCHSIVAQGEPGNLEVGTVTTSLEFKHPVDIGDEWKSTLCVECHKELYP